AGPINVASCAPPQVSECIGDSDSPTCRTVCELGASTLRAELAEALVFDFLLTPQNRTGIEVVDMLSMIERIRESRDPELFGDAEPEPMAGRPPVITVVPTTMDDESRDIITFSEYAEP